MAGYLDEMASSGFSMFPRPTTNIEYITVKYPTYFLMVESHFRKRPFGEWHVRESLLLKRVTALSQNKDDVQN